MSQLLPSWLPYTKRLDGGFARLDSAGWMPGLESVTSEARARSVENAGKYYQPLLANLHIDPVAERALREILTTCQTRNISVTLLWMPESSEFRGWYSPESLKTATTLLEQLKSQYGPRVMIARDWMPDDALADGYHLTAPASAIFTAKLANLP